MVAFTYDLVLGTMGQRMLLLLLLTVVATGLAEEDNDAKPNGTIFNVSLSANGSVTVSEQDILTVVCRVFHNSTQLTTFFYLNDLPLKTVNPLVQDRTIRLMQYNDCQSQSQEECQELILVVRANQQFSGTKIDCRSRPRDSVDMFQSSSEEVVHVTVKDSVAEAPVTPSCSQPTPTSTSSPPTSSSSVSSTPEVDITSTDKSQEDNSPLVIFKGRERAYVVVLGCQTFFLILAFFVVLFLLWRLHRKTKNRSDPLSDLEKQEELNKPEELGKLNEVKAEETQEILDDKLPSHSRHKTSDTDTSSVTDRSGDEEPRYVECTRV